MVGLPGAQPVSPGALPLRGQCLPCLTSRTEHVSRNALCVLAPALAAPTWLWPRFRRNFQACGALPCPSDMVPACMTPPSVGATPLGVMVGPGRSSNPLSRELLLLMGSARLCFPQGGRGKIN